VQPQIPELSQLKFGWHVPQLLAGLHGSGPQLRDPQQLHGGQL
jgi:hypothetical protein